MNVGLLNSSKRSSKERVGSGTMPNTAIKTAPPAIQSVLRTIHGENTSPRMRRAKKAFHRSDTAPSGARMTTGSEAIWNMDPKRFEDMKIPERHELRDQQGSTEIDRRVYAPKPNSQSLQAGRLP